MSKGSGGVSGWLVAALALALLGCGAEDSRGTAAQEGGGAPAAAVLKPAPDFTLRDVHGKEVALADYRGKAVIVDFWATWCPPCIFQVPELNKFWKTHHSAGDVMVIGVAVDAEGAEVVRPWAEEQGIEYTIVIGDEGLAREYGALGFPTLVIVTPEGNVDSLHVGLIEVEDLEGLVAPFRRTGST